MVEILVIYKKKYYKIKLIFFREKKLDRLLNFPKISAKGVAKKKKNTKYFVTGCVIQV